MARKGLDTYLTPGKHIHLVGIGGVSMRPLGLVLRRAALALPFCAFAGLSNLLLERQVLLWLGPVPVTVGLASCGVLLLRALLCQPVQTLLLDEPFTGMDPELVSHAAAAVVRLAARRDTVLVTHDEHAADLLGWPVVRLETVGK